MQRGAAAFDPVEGELAASTRPFARPANEWGPLGLSFLARLARDPVGALPAECFERHDLLQRVAHRMVFFPTAPSTIRDFCREDGRALTISRMQARRFRPAIGEGMIAAEGAVWRRQREEGQRIMSQAARRLAAEGPSDDFNAAFADPQYDLFTALKHACLARFIDLLFPRGEHAKASLPIPQLSEAVDAFVLSHQRITLADLFPLPAPNADITHVFDELIEDEARRSGLAGRLKKARVPLRDFVASMLIGYYPTAIVLAWLCIEASRNPFLSEALHREARNVSSAKVAPKSMPLAMSALQETMRLYPPFPFATREAVRDCVLSETHIKRGTLVLVSPLVVQRHSRLWDEPGRFAPERFAGERPPRESYFPFGAGERMCIGAGLSMNVLLEATHTLFASGRGRIVNADSVGKRGMFLLLPDRPLAWMMR